MTKPYKTTSFMTPAMKGASKRAILFAGPRSYDRVKTLPELQKLSAFVNAFSPDHAVNVRQSEDHQPLLDLLGQDDQLAIMQRRLAEDVPDAGVCVFFLPKLKTDPVEAHRLEPLSQALRGSGFDRIELVVPTSDVAADHMIVQHAEKIDWEHLITVQDFAELPLLQLGILKHDLIAEVREKTSATLRKGGFRVNEARLSGAVQSELDSLLEAGLDLTSDTQQKVSGLLIAKLETTFRLTEAQ